jgi:hypothetical protein
MGSGFDLAEVKWRFAIPSRQNHVHEHVGRFLENLLQLLRYLFRNAFHGNLSIIRTGPPAHDNRPILTENRQILLLTFLQPFMQ